MVCNNLLILQITVVMVYIWLIFFYLLTENLADILKQDTVSENIKRKLKD